jgi:hypothetical protein
VLIRAPRSAHDLGEALVSAYWLCEARKTEGGIQRRRLEQLQELDCCLAACAATSFGGVEQPDDLWMVGGHWLHLRRS